MARPEGRPPTGGGFRNANGNAYLSSGGRIPCPWQGGHLFPRMAEPRHGRTVPGEYATMSLGGSGDRPPDPHDAWRTSARQAGGTEKIDLDDSGKVVGLF